MLSNSVSYDVSLVCKVVFQVLRIMYEEACLCFCTVYDGALVSGQGTVFLYCIGQGWRQFIFRYVVYGHICLRCILCRTYLYTYRVLITYDKNGRGSMRYIYFIIL